MTTETDVVLTAVRMERDRQNLLYPHFADTYAEMGLILSIESGELFRALGKLTWMCHLEPDDIRDEVYANAYEEAIQVAAVATRLAEAIARRDQSGEGRP